MTSRRGSGSKFTGLTSGFGRGAYPFQPGSGIVRLAFSSSTGTVPKERGHQAHAIAPTPSAAPTHQTQGETRERRRSAGP